MVRINLKIQKKDLWLLSAIIVFLVAVGYVIAYNAAMSGGDPAVMGHSSDEIHVKNKTGSLVSLQTLIDQGGLGGESCSLGDWVEENYNVKYEALTDGFVFAYAKVTDASDAGDFTGYVYPSASGAEELVIKDSTYVINDPSASITFPVKKGKWWKVALVGGDGGGTKSIYWIPIVSGGSSGLDLTNCAWTGWSTCTASGASNQLICPAGQVVRGYQRTGCTSASPACDDPARCEKVQLYCCG